MTLQTSGPISLGNVQTEFGGANPAAMSEYYAGGAYVPSSTSGTNGAVPTSGTISMSKFFGTTRVVFTPDGGTTAGSAVALFNQNAVYASVTILCNVSATWNYTRTSGLYGTADVTNGGSATSITFSITNNSFSQMSGSWTVSATSGGVTRYWTVSIIADGIA